MTEKLKPCPFCGGEAEMSVVAMWSKITMMKITCVDCGCELPSVTKPRNKFDAVYAGEKAIEKWNTRKDKTK